MDYLEKVAIPSSNSINSGIEPCHVPTMLNIFGEPGTLSRNCSPITSRRLQAKIETQDVGPFKATGHVQVLAILTKVFAAVKVKEPELYPLIKTNGMLCCRAVRGTNVFSNHSWGMAIDLQVGAFDEYGSEKCSQGLLSLYPYMHVFGMYWGAAFPRKDAMHFEAGADKINEWKASGLLV